MARNNARRRRARGSPRLVRAVTALSAVVTVPAVVFKVLPF